MTDINTTLSERGARYGDFSTHACIAWDIKNAIHAADSWDALPYVHKQALDVIADKIARILNGNPNYADNWHDIQGYAKLVEDTLVTATAGPEPAAEEPAIPRGWTKWQVGSEIPKGSIEVVLRGGYTSEGDASDFRWGTRNDESAIVAYRRIERP